MNPYALRRQHLKLVRLPISPPPQWGELDKYSKGLRLCGKGEVVSIYVHLFGNASLGRFKSGQDRQKSRAILRNMNLGRLCRQRTGKRQRREELAAALLLIECVRSGNQLHAGRD